MFNHNTKIILFDGVCNLCKGFVRFTIKKDPNAKFKFASLQSTIGQSLLTKFSLPKDNFDSLVYISGDNYFLKSSAVLNILKEFGGIWKVFYVFIFIPKFIRDFIYDIVAKTRYSIFGKCKECVLPSEDIQQHFIE